MDPNASLKELLRACAEGDREAMFEATEALSGWLYLGGFLPSLSSVAPDWADLLEAEAARGAPQAPT